MPSFHTTDGVTLNYLVQGPSEGIETLVFVPAFCQPAWLYVDCLQPVAARGLRCITLDHRGHGTSQAPSYGYRLARMAKDLRELLEHLELSGVVLAGHSMGGAVMWQYLELFGQDKISKLILCDQMASGLIRPSWSLEQRAQYGAHASGEELLKLVSDVADEEQPDPRREFLSAMFTENYPAEAKAAALDAACGVPRSAGARLVLDTMSADFRDVLPRITLPTLCIGGTCSHLKDCTPWIASQIPQSKLVMVEGGSHFMLVEDPARFAADVLTFIGR